MKYNYEKARAALTAHPIGEKILAYQQREEIPLDSAIDDAQTGRLGGDVAQWANSLPSFWTQEGDELAKRAAQDRAMQALRPAQAAINAKILAMVEERKLFVWETDHASGVDFADPSAKAELDAALERVLAIYLPLLEGTGWTRDMRVVPRADEETIERVVTDNRAQREAERIARLRATTTNQPTNQPTKKR